MAKRIQKRKRTQNRFDPDSFPMTEAEFEQTLREGNGIYWDYDPVTEEIRPYDEKTVAERLRANSKANVN